MVEGRDWFVLVAGGGPCPDCGLDAAAVVVQSGSVTREAPRPIARAASSRFCTLG